MKIDHAFYGKIGGLCWCGAPERMHRVRAYHAPVGDPCSRCGKPAKAHGSPEARQRRKEREQSRSRNREHAIIGIDGEGHDLPDGRHIYTLLCAVDEQGNVVAEAENPNGLSTKECTDMLLSLPQGGLKFMFMGSYDWTKIIEDLELLDIGYIMHPDARRVRHCKSCQRTWGPEDKDCPRCGHPESRSILRLRRVSKDKHGNPLRLAFDWFNGSFTIASEKRRTKVWDCFKFFQCSFVKAIKLWKIGTPEQWARIEDMKNKRGAFDVEDPAAIRQYCREECHLLAQMMREVLKACSAAGIELRQYHGAGSIANALLKQHKVKDYMGPPVERLPAPLQHAIMSAYFGGRFENSVVGFVNEPVDNRDIYSAYPYAIAQLPCLSCGEWKHVSMSRHKDVMRKARSATLAVVHFRVKSRTVFERKDLAWAPLPCRQADGCIAFPTGFEGWAWLPEIEQALKGWPDLIEVLECWTYRTTCEHKPFAWIPGAYRKRFEWGKDGRGIVMKLGLNACAGKTMQTEGDPPPFKSFIWGGMITATTRSQSLAGICIARDPWNVLAIATDGLFSTERLNLPDAKDTGTGDLEKPLGNWGRDEHEHGVFFVKPGMYYELDGGLMRARGIGRTEMKDNRGRLASAFETWDRKSELKIEVMSRRFYGAKSAVLMYSHCPNVKCGRSWPGWPEKGCPGCKELGLCEAKSMNLPDKETPAYGRWAKRKIVIEFQSYPKREVISDGGTFGRMRVRDLGGIVSLPYEPGKTTPEGEAARLANQEALEEPDWEDWDTDEVA